MAPRLSEPEKVLAAAMKKKITPLNKPVGTADLKIRIATAISKFIKKQKNVEKMTKVISKLVVSDATVSDANTIYLAMRYVCFVMSMRTHPNEDYKSVKTIHSHLLSLLTMDYDTRLWSHGVYEIIRKMDSQSKEPPKLEKGVYKCKKCKSQNTVSQEIQKRSGDEGMTSFIYCLEKKCGASYQIN